MSKHTDCEQEYERYQNFYLVETFSIYLNTHIFELACCFFFFFFFFFCNAQTKEKQSNQFPLPQQGDHNVRQNPLNAIVYSAHPRCFILCVTEKRPRDPWRTLKRVYSADSQEEDWKAQPDFTVLKAPYSSKIDIFIQESFNKLIYGINMTLKCGSWQPVKLQEDSLFWTVSKLKWFFYRISEINVGNINSEIR